MKQIFNFIQKSLVIVSAFSLLALFSAPAALAQGGGGVGGGAGGGAGGAGASSAKDAVCDGVNLTGTGCDGSGGGTTVNEAIATAINILSFIVGVIAVIMIIVAGIKFITSSGDPAGVSSAKQTIIFAAVGLIVVALAQVIVRFVLSQFD